MKQTILTLVLAGILTMSGSSQTFDKAKLDKYFDALETNNRFMGSVAVAKDGAIIYSRSVGAASLEGKLKANENTKYRIGSISKTFTAVLIMKAIEEKKMSLDQTIGAWFPTIKNANKITVRQLLSHRSGIHNFTDDAAYLGWHTQPKTETEMIAIIAKGESDFEPDSKAAYSNSNYVLLTYMLEKTFKGSYASLLQEYICKPLGLANTYFGGKTDLNKNESRSYRYIGTWKAEPETDMSIPVGAGGILSTPVDLVKFGSSLLGGKLLKPGSLETMKDIKDGYGLGLIRLPFYNMQGYGHGGGIDGFNSILSHFADGNIAYALTSNGTNFNTNDISLAVLSAVYDKPYSLPKFVDIGLSSEDLNRYLGVYASGEVPLKISITKNGNILIAQATGQPAFSLEATEKDKFKFDPVGVVIEFDPVKGTMLLKQGGGQFVFTKE